MHVEQTYRNAFGLKKSKCIDWIKLNVSLAKRFLGKQGRWAIAIDPSYNSKAGKKTPHIGRFWSGCAQSVYHGLDIIGIGLIDIDTKDCMMLRAHQSLNNKNKSETIFISKPPDLGLNLNEPTEQHYTCR